jgi:hypothetical protein
MAIRRRNTPMPLYAPKTKRQLLFQIKAFLLNVFIQFFLLGV